MNLSVAGAQLGPYAGSFEAQKCAIQELSRRLINENSPDLLILPELISGPYFAIEEDSAWFDTAEEIPGPTSEFLCQIAKEYGCFVTGTLFHKNGSQYLNTAVLAKPDGTLGENYSKTHIPYICHGSTRNYETFYFSGGENFVIWEINGINTGILICYDRSFPEAWRELRLRGADIVIVLASSSGFRSTMFVQELQVRAVENGVWVIAVNKGGDEYTLDDQNPADFYGSSCVIGPDGEVKTRLGRVPWSGFYYDIDLSDLTETRKKLGYYSARRPDLYRSISEPK